MPTLEAQLTALTQEFVGKLVDVLRNASFGEVAALSSRRPAAPARSTPREPRRDSPLAPSTAADRRRDGDRQTAAKRAELGERILGALRSAPRPMGVRALSSDLGVSPDVLAAPLRELRAAEKVRKHGEKRSTTYSI